MNRHAADCTRIQEALPWYVNGTVAAAQRMEVKSHLQHCGDCATELEWLATIRNEMPVLASEREAAVVDENGAFEQLMGRIRNDRHKRDRWLLLAAASVLLAIATLFGSLLTTYLVEPRFQTVTDAVTPAQDVVQVEVRFAPEAQLVSLRSVMEKTAAEVRKGPDADGWILLEVPLHKEQVAADVLAALKADEQVLDARYPVIDTQSEMEQ
jgi:anti-sigma factor RsiW